MRILKLLCAILVFQSMILSAVSAETLMQDGVVVSYELGEEEPGKFSIEIQNDNRHDVEVILNVYAMLTGRALGSIYCNENFLKSYELQAGRILRVLEPGCEPKRFRTLEAYVKIIGVKDVTPQPVESEAGEQQEEDDRVASPASDAGTTPMAETLEQSEGPKKKDETTTMADAAESAPDVEIPEPSQEPPLPEEMEGDTTRQERLEETAETPTEKAAPAEKPEQPDETEQRENMTPEGERLVVEGSHDVDTVAQDQAFELAKGEFETESPSASSSLEVETVTALTEPAEGVSEDEAERDGEDSMAIEVETVAALMPKDEIPSEPGESEKIPDPVVQDIQNSLLTLGYHPGPVDGLMGRKTEAAIVAFQQDEALPADGQASSELLLRLSERLAQQMITQKKTIAQPAQTSESQGERGVLAYGILLDGPQQTDAVEILHQELVQLFGSDIELEQQILTGDWTGEQVAKHLDQFLNDPGVDMIVALDVIASHEAAHRQELAKPVFAPFIVDEQLQQLSPKEMGSGIRNLNYLISLPKIENGMKMFRRMASFTHVAILMSRYYYDAVPEMQEYILEREAMLAEEKQELSITPVLAGESVDATLEQIPSDVDAVYIIPVLHFSDMENQLLFSALNEKKLLTFSHLGLGDLEQGVLATIAPKSDLQRLARRIALNIQRALEGEDPGTFPVYFRKEGEEELAINMETARQIGFYPTFATLMNATLLNERSESIDRQLTLADAVQEALEANLDFLSKQQEVTVGEKNIAIANAVRLPQLDFSGSGSLIDEDRASAAAFGASEQVLSASAGLTQLIYSDKANANVSIQKSLQQRLENELEQTKLDITQLAATSYLSVLRAKTLLNIQQDNLVVTKSNLAVARTRVSVGATGKGEVYRWEAELGTSQQDVVDAQNAIKQAELNLNRILHRPQEEKFATLETEMTDPFQIEATPLLKYINNRLIFELFRDFAVKTGLEHAPELAQIDAALKAQERLVSSFYREYMVPSIALKGDLTGILAKGGEGSDDVDMSGLPSELADIFSSPDDVAWSVGVGLSWPIFSGGGKRAEHQQAKLEFEKLLIDKASISETLEQRIRSAVYQTGNAYVKIGFAKDSAEAARKTLELVTLAYTEGLSTILDVIDAQNATLVAEQLVADTTYNFLLDLVNAQRATNRFDFLLSEKELKEGYQEFEEFLQEQGISIAK